MNRSTVSTSSFVAMAANRSRRYAQISTGAAVNAGRSIGSRRLRKSRAVAGLRAFRSRTVIGSMIRDLAAHPDQRQLLLERPELLATNAVEEFIRWVSPILNMRRTATVDHELHGQTIREGDELLLLYASANRDPRAFHAPDVLDVTRTDNRHLAFGVGIHGCVGMAVARLEAEIVLTLLAQRVETIEPCGEPERRLNNTLRGLARLPIAVRAA